MSHRERLQMRLTKIVCTIGPACSRPDQLKALVKAGMNVARFNLTHASAEDQMPVVRTLKRIRRAFPCPTGILLDIRGAQVRTGKVAEPLKITKGQTVCFGTAAKAAAYRGKEKFITVDYSAFGKDVAGAETLLIDNGELSFDVLSAKGGVARARARQSGAIGSKRHVNMPGATISLPTLTERDWKDIDAAVKERVDFLAVSFIRSSEDITEVKEYLRSKKSRISVIAKIETRQAIRDLAAIIEASDGIMIARGDLGAEIPFEEVPVLQDETVAICINAGKPVIVATHMLESMIEHPLPTRAEVTDVAHAAAIRTDATMLSGETAAGRHPALALDAMHRILVATERRGKKVHVEEEMTVRTESEARAEVAVDLAATIGASAIVVMTKTGRSARDISKLRPTVPIIAITDDSAAWGSLSLSYGVHPIVASFKGELEDSVARGMREAVKNGLLARGQEVVLVTGTRIKGGSVISVQARRVAG